MRRVALMMVAAVAVLGTGCTVTTTCSSPNGSLTLYWQFIDGLSQAYGNYTPANNGCAVAGVDYVAVTVGTGATQVFPCEDGQGTPGVTLTEIPDATYDVTVEGLRGGPNGETVYVATTTGDVFACADTTIDVPLAAVSPSSLVIYYSINGEFRCTDPASPGTTFTGIHYSLESGSTVISSDTIPCDPVSFGFSIPALSFGRYDLYFIQAMYGGGALYEKCGTVIDHYGPPTIVDLMTAPDPNCG